MAFQSDKMTLLGHGKVDFRTEKLNLEWITKPRKGIGVSASMLTNPYIRLGGTLSNPALQLKEAEAVVSTGAAVATLGLSLVAKGMYDRVTAEKKVCKKALEEIGARGDGKPR
jgi:AsmA protein